MRCVARPQHPTHARPAFNAHTRAQPVVPRSGGGGGGGGSGMAERLLRKGLDHARSAADGALSMARDALNASGSRDFYLTRVVDALCELRPKSEDETFVYLDPKVSLGRSVARSLVARVAPRRAVVRSVRLRRRAT